MNVRDRRSNVVRTTRVLGAGPFGEIGHPTVAAASDALLVVAGDLGAGQWNAWDVRGPRRLIGVYRTDDLGCLGLFHSRWPVRCLAIHPTSPLVAVGTGAYDGGYQYEGELLLLNTESGRVVSALEDVRQVSSVEWLDDRTLTMVLEPPCDEEDSRFELTVARDWTTVAARSVETAGSPTDRVPTSTPALRTIATVTDVSWTPRREVWAVHALSDGRVLAASENTALECWPPDADEPAWSIPTTGTGCQIKVAPDERTAFINVHPPGLALEAVNEISIVDLATGRPTTAVDTTTPTVLVGRRDGLLAARSTRLDPVRPEPVQLLDRAGHRVGRVEITRYDLFNHYFDVRHAPELLFLRGDRREPHRDKQVVAADESGLRVKFPLEWDADRAGHLFGGPGVYLAAGAIVHTGSVYSGRGLLPGNAFVVRRDYETGHAQWVHTADHQPTAIDTDDDTVYVTFTSGDLVALDAVTGVVLARQRLTANGHPVVPLSMSSAGDRLVIGTRNGYVLDCTVER